MVDTCADPTTVVMGFDSTLGKNTFTFSESRLVSVYDNLMRVNVTLDQMKEAIGLQVGEFIFQSGEIEKSKASCLRFALPQYAAYVQQK